MELPHYLTQNVGTQDDLRPPLLSSKDEFIEEPVTQGVGLGKVPPTSECPHRMVRRSCESLGWLKL